MTAPVIDELSHGRYPLDALVEGQTFRREVFTSFAINPKDGVEVRIKDCTFDHCRISRGAFLLGRGVVLEGVVINDFEGAGQWGVDSGARMVHTRFTSSRADDVLWVKNHWGLEGDSSNVIELDISRFAGRVIITGNDVSRVITDPERHLFVRAELLDQDQFDLNRANPFVSNAAKVKNNGANVGVFSLPRPEDTHLFDGFTEQLEYFESVGLVSREFPG